MSEWSGGGLLLFILIKTYLRWSLSYTTLLYSSSNSIYLDSTSINFLVISENFQLLLYSSYIYFSILTFYGAFSVFTKSLSFYNNYRAILSCSWLLEGRLTVSLMSFIWFWRTNVISFFIVVKDSLKSVWLLFIWDKKVTSNLYYSFRLWNPYIMSFNWV